MTSMTAGLCAALACGLFVTGCRDSPAESTAASPAASPAAGDAVIARIDGQPVLASEVRLHLRAAPPRIGTAPAVDPRRVALDAAIRVRLFAQEGRRRGLAAKGAPATVQAMLVRGVIDAETSAAELRGDGVSDEDARVFYERDPKRFNRPTEVRVAAVAVDDERAAEELLVKASTASEAELAALGAKDLGVIDEHGEGVDPAIAGTAMWLKHPGAVGLAPGSDGRYYVLRATEVKIVIKPWTADAMRVKNVVAEERRNAVLSRLEERLRKTASIEIDEAALASLPKRGG